jgi:hypothetical protein
MARDTPTVFADAVLRQLRAADETTNEGIVLVSLPAYLDATEVHLLQTELNRHSAMYIELQHRPGERRVGVRLVAPLRRR